MLELVILKIRWRCTVHEPLILSRNVLSEKRQTIKYPQIKCKKKQFKKKQKQETQYK